MAGLLPNSERLWQLAVINMARQRHVKAAVQLAAEGGPAAAGAAVRQQLLAEVALLATAGIGQPGLKAAEAEQLIAACAAAGFGGEQGSELAQAAVQLADSMSAAGQQPNEAALRAVMGGTVHLLRASQPGEQSSTLLGTLRQLLTVQPLLAAELSDSEWDVLASAVSRSSSSSSSSSDDAALAAQLLTEHGPLPTAVSRQQRWGSMLQLAAAAAGSAGVPNLADVVSEWAAAAAAKQPPTPQLSPGVQLALMGAHHTPAAELEAALEPLVLALSKVGRTAEVSSGVLPSALLCSLLLAAGSSSQIHTDPFRLAPPPAWLPLAAPASAAAPAKRHARRLPPVDPPPVRAAAQHAAQFSVEDWCRAAASRGTGQAAS